MEIKYYSLYIAAAIVFIFAILQSALGLDLSWQVGTIEIQFLTSMFAHGSMAHLLGNLFSLLLFGLILEGTIGSKNFLYVLLAAAALGNLAAIGSYGSVLGISGGIYGLIGALMILRPKMVIWLSGLPMPMILVGIAYGFIDLLGAFAPADNTGHLAHLAGLVVGIVAGFWFRDDNHKPRKKRRLDNQQKRVIDNQLDMYEQRYLR